MNTAFNDKGLDLLYKFTLYASLLFVVSSILKIFLPYNGISYIKQPLSNVEYRKISLFSAQNIEIIPP